MDWRKGLALHHFNQAKALWSEADLDYMLIKSPDSEFNAVIAQNSNKLQSATRMLLKKRADKVTGLKLSTDCTHMPHDPAFGVEYSFKGSMIAQVCPDLPTEADLEVAATPVGPALSAPAPGRIPPPAKASTSTAGASAENPIIFSSDSDVANTPLSGFLKLVSLLSPQANLSN